MVFSNLTNWFLKKPSKRLYCVGCRDHRWINGITLHNVMVKNVEREQAKGTCPECKNKVVGFI